MSEKPMSNQLKKGTLVLNLLIIPAIIFFEVVLYKYVSYKNYLALEYLPVKYIVFVEILLAVAAIIPFVIKWGKKSTILSLVYSILMILVLVSVSIFALVHDKQIKNVVLKADTTLDKIMENSKQVTDEYGVYVLKEDSAKELKDAAEYKFGYNTQYSAEDIKTVINAMESELSAPIHTNKYADPVALAESLIQKHSGAIILNSAMIDTIENAGDDSDNDTQDGIYSDFSEQVKCIYRITVKNALSIMSDSGNVTGKCFNVYISGIDTEGSVETKSRSDVNIVMSVNPITKKVILISTPRDYYVPLSISNGVRDKLTHAGNYGIDVSMKTLEQLYETKFDYYIRMNFTGFVNIIDALGGIDVESDYSFSTHGYSYSEGLNENLSGIEALWFARERHAFAEGDRQRGKDQMKVIEAVIKKCQSAALLENYDEILDNVSDSFQTNMTKNSIKKLVKFQLNQSPDWDIITYSVSGQGTSDYTYTVPSQRAYVMVPDESTVEIAKKLLTANKNNKNVKDPETAEDSNE